MSFGLLPKGRKKIQYYISWAVILWYEMDKYDKTSREAQRRSPGWSPSLRVKMVMRTHFVIEDMFV